MLKAAAALLLCACVGTGKAEPKRLGLIAAVEAYTSWHTWKLTPWVRIAEDMTRPLPILIVIASDGRACLVDGAVWTLAKAGEYHDCASGWRFPR